MQAIQEIIMFINISLFVHLSACPLVRLSTCPLVHLSACPLVRLSTCPPVRQFTKYLIPLPHGIDPPTKNLTPCPERLSTIFQQESRNLFDGALITVTKVQVTKDLAIAKVYLSLFIATDKQVLLDKIRHHGREVRHLLALRVHNQLRVMPDLQFFLDDSLDYIENIDSCLNK